MDSKTLRNIEVKLEKAVEKHRSGDIEAASIVYSEILSTIPNHAKARHMMAVVHLHKGRLEKAEDDVRRALKINNDEAKYFNTLGSILVQQGRLPEALSTFEVAFSKDPDFTTAAYNRGTVLLFLGKPRDAEIEFLRILKEGGEDVGIFNNLASALIKQNRIDDAVECCRDGLKLHQSNPELGTTLASALELSNNLLEAEEEARKVCDAYPDFNLSALILARILRRQGALDEAYETLEPIFPTFLETSDWAEANYEMGLIQDTRKRYAEAFRHFSRCNASIVKSTDASRVNGDKYLDKVRGYSRWKNGPSKKPILPLGASPSLVFFVGFPRSGTTLMEQVLKSHPKLMTTEEISPLSPVETEARKLAADQSLTYPECLDEWGQDIFENLRRLFLTETEDIVGSLAGNVLVDKLPLNIVSLGLVEKLWPEARVLVALRDPRDVCLSCFIQRFTLNNAMANFLDLNQTSILYANVMGLWLRYRETLSLPYLEYNYEELVDNFENTTRRVLEFVGVDWHDDVINYRDKAKQRIIHTPSYREVTAPIHKKAVQRWKNYQGELTPIYSRLDQFVKAFGYGV
tara:strand:- start:147 stop:1874 length:1728 start_codon:yes stop_codon:yes gene_type:complete